MVETDDISFSWGKKKGRGGTKKEVQFYESFTYDGVEYSLYDSVYLYKEGEPEPYIGKLIKIWEPANKARKVKILWFFYPLEISNHLGDEKVLENELFLASGDGAGLANVNPLEAIAGKCNVVCISKDEKNRQPSVEELEMADYVFYRTFDVGSLTISDKLGEKIASIEVESLLNKKGVQLLNQSLNIEVDSQNVVAVVEKPLMTVKDIAGEGNSVKLDINIGSPLVKGEEGTNDLMDKSKGPLEAHDVAGPDGRGPASLPVTEISVSGQKTKLKSPNSKQADLSEVVKSAPDARPSENRACSRSEPSDSASMSNEKRMNYGEKTVVASGENIKNPVSSNVAADEGKLGAEKKFDGPSDAVKKQKSVNSRVALEERLSKKPKRDVTPTHSSENGKKVKDGTATPATINARNGALQSGAVSSDHNKTSQPAVAVPAEISDKGKLAKEFHGISNGDSEKLKADGGENNKSNNKLCKASLKPDKGLEVKEPVGTSNALSKILKPNSMVGKSDAKEGDGLSKRLKSDDIIKDEVNKNLHKASLKPCKDVEIEAYGCVKEVTRRPLTDKEKYYTSFESRMKVAQDQGTLVLLQNLDLAYTSSEVEDIIWCAFRETCSAKIIQRTATSSPHSGQAFVIFKTREAAERIVSRLEEECLMLPNLRPLVAFPGALSSPEKQSSFPGHLIIDKLKHQMQRESREAVSTSHSSQSNTFEYELALEWRLLQDRSDLYWRKLHKQQGEELKKLKRSFKPKK